MQTMNTALLVGPYDWDATLLPRAEFEPRVAAAERMIVQRGLAALIVHGSSQDNGAMAYLTGFTPKLGSGFALIAPGKPIRIIVPGSAAMLETAKRLTWVEDLKPLRDPGKDIADWLAEAAGPGSSGLAVGLWGAATMPGALYGRIAGALKPSATVEEHDIAFDSLRRRKSARERELMRRAAAALSAAVEAFGRARGTGARSAAIAAERAAFAKGAQDVRILAGGRDGGAPLPLDGIDERKPDPLLVFIAVRLAGYWAEGLFTLGAKPTGALEHASAALQAALAAARAGVSGSDLARAAEAKLAPYRRHPAIGASIGHGIGLSLVESPDFNEDREARLEDGGVYSIKVGAAGEGADNAVLSAMVEIADGRANILWSGLAG